MGRAGPLPFMLPTSSGLPGPGTGQQAAHLRMEAPPALPIPTSSGWPRAEQGGPATLHTHCRRGWRKMSPAPGSPRELCPTEDLSPSFGPVLPRSHVTPTHQEVERVRQLIGVPCRELSPHPVSQNLSSYLELLIMHPGVCCQRGILLYYQALHAEKIGAQMFGKPHSLKKGKGKRTFLWKE